MPELQFKGKEFVYNHHLSVPFRPLVPDAAKSIVEAGHAARLDGNLVIHGDNLHALKALLPMYAGKVDCIYIDPPYNTGNEGWCYNDNVNSPYIKEWLTQNPIGVDDGLRHDKWLAMMFPRLRLLHELLANHGVIYVSIDDYEEHRLRAVLDDIFGGENFIAKIIARLNPKGRHLDKFFAKTHEYVLVYAKDLENVEVNGIAKSDEMVAEYSEEDATGKHRLIELRNRNSAFNPTTRPNLYFPIYVNPTTQAVSVEKSSEYCDEALPLDSSGAPTCWTWGKPKVVTDNGFLVARKTGSGSWRVFRKDYLVQEDGDETTTKPKTVWLDADLNMDAARKTVSEILIKNAFDFPKPVPLVERLVELAHSDALVLDSFAGSGTTAHAVLSANAKDGGNRKFILVEGEDYADRLTAERVRRVIAGYKFSGKRKTELLRKSLSYTTLKNAHKLIAQVEAIENLHGHEYDKITKTVKDDTLLVVGEKDVQDKVDGLGGTFTYCTLGDPIDLKVLLSGNKLPPFEQIGGWLYNTATNEAFNPAHAKSAEFYLGESAAYNVWLYYKPDLDFLKSRDAALTLQRAEEIAAKKPFEKTGKRNLVFAPAKFAPNKALHALGVEYAPLPFALFKIDR